MHAVQSRFRRAPIALCIAAALVLAPLMVSSPAWAETEEISPSVEVPEIPVPDVDEVEENILEPTPEGDQVVREDSSRDRAESRDDAPQPQLHSQGVVDSHPDFIFQSDQTSPVATATVTGYSGSETDVVIPGQVTIDGVDHTVTIVGEEAFALRGLTSVQIPDTVVSVGSGAFMGNRLTEVSIPDSVIEIGSEAFFDNITTKVTLGSSVDRIGSSAFEHYDWDADRMLPLEVTFTGAPPTHFVPGGPTIFSGSFSDIDDVVISYPAAYSAENYAGGFTRPTWNGYGTVPHVVVQFDLGVAGAELQNVRVPAGEPFTPPAVTEPGGFGFSGWYLNPEHTEPFEIGDEVASDVTLYADWELLERLETVAVDGVIYMADVHDPEATASAVGPATPHRVNITIRPSVEIAGNIYTVTNIGPHSFDGAGLTSVTLPNTIIEIEEYAFASYDFIDDPDFPGQNDLGDLVIPDSVQTIGAYAFLSAGLTSAHFGSGLQHIGEGAFIDSGLSDLDLPEGLLTIAPMAFNDNTLRRVFIPGSVKLIDEFAFYNGTIEELTLSPGTREIGIAAFAENHLTEVNLPDSVEHVRAYAFLWNPFVQVDIGAAIKGIGVWAFANEVPVISRSFDALAEPETSTMTVRFAGAPPTDFMPAGYEGSFGPGENVLVQYHLDFDVSVLPGGFTTPTWQGYNTQTLATVTLDLQGHGPTEAIVIPVGETLENVITAPVTDNWIFTGWYLDAAGEQRLDLSSPVAENLTLYAGWVADGSDVPPHSPVTPGAPGSDDSRAQDPSATLADSGAESAATMLWVGIIVLLAGVGVLTATRRASARQH